MVPTAALQKIGESPIFSKFSTAYRIIRSNPRGQRIWTVSFLVRSRPITSKPFRYPSVNVSAIFFTVSSGRLFKKAESERSVSEMYSPNW